MTAGAVNGALAAFPVALVPWSNALAAQATVQRSGWEQAADVAMVLVALLLVVLLGIIAFMLNELRKGQQKLMNTAEKFSKELGPSFGSINELTANIREVSDIAVRRAAQVDETIMVANKRVRSAVDVAYRRVREIDALLEVIQSEAEGLFVTTAAGITGFKRGAKAIFGKRGLRRKLRGFGVDDSRRRRFRQDAEADDWDDEADAPGDSDHAAENLSPADTEPHENGPSVRSRRTRRRMRNSD